MLTQKYGTRQNKPELYDLKYLIWKFKKKLDSLLKYNKNKALIFFIIFNNIQ